MSYFTTKLKNPIIVTLALQILITEKYTNIISGLYMKVFTAYIINIKLVVI